MVSSFPYVKYRKKSELSSKQTNHAAPLFWRTIYQLLAETTFRFVTVTLVFISLLLTLAGGIGVFVSVCARKLKSTTSSLLKYTSVTDMGIGIFILLPSFVSITSGDGFLQNKLYCSLQGCFGQALLVANSLFLCLQAIERLSVLNRKIFEWILTEYFNSACIGIVITSGLISGLPLVDVNYFVYRRNIFHCMASKDKFPVFSMVCGYAFPIALTILIAITLIKRLSKRSMRRLHIQQNVLSENRVVSDRPNPNNLSVRPAQTVARNPGQKKKSNLLTIDRDLRDTRPSLLPNEVSSSFTIEPSSSLGIPKNEMRSTKALICIHIPVACCHLSSFILRYLAYLDESNANIYGAFCIITLAFACFLQPVIAMLVSSALRKVFVGLICRKNNNGNTRVFKLTLETPHPREERSSHVDMPEFLRPRSGMRIQLEVVRESDSLSHRRSRNVSAISMTSDGISIIDIDEYISPLDRENSSSIGSLACQADASSLSPSLSTMSNLTLNIGDLPWQRGKQRNRVTNKFWIESLPPSQQSFFQDGTTEFNMMHRTSSLPTIRISSPRTPKTPGRKMFKRVIPNERTCTLATVEDVMSVASTPRSSEASRGRESLQNNCIL